MSLPPYGEGIRLLVTGGRDYADWRRVHAELDAIHDELGIGVLIEGGCRYQDPRGARLSADRFAWEWAMAAQVPCFTFWAPWRRYGKPAGPLRNTTMVRMTRPHLGLAFPGGSGTENCVDALHAAGVKVRRVAKEGA